MVREHGLEALEALREPIKTPPGFGLRQSPGAFGIAGRSKSGRGLPHSKTLPRPTTGRDLNARQNEVETILELRRTRESEVADRRAERMRSAFSRTLLRVGFLRVIGIFGVAFANAFLALGATEERPDPEAAALVAEMLSQRPPADLEIKGMLRIRDARGKLSKIPISYTIKRHADRWEGIYATGPTDALPAERLTVVHRGQSPNQYLLWRASDSKRTDGAPIALTGGQSAIPFAGSDFWLADLGLEFLHWPKQRLVKDAIQVRNHRQCQVLESTNPNPSEANYSRVVSWVDREFGGLVYAIAYDAAGQKFKIFSLKSFSKGQVTGMEILNEKKDTKTYLELQPGSREVAQEEIRR